MKKGARGVPHYYKHKDYESNIGKIRTEEGYLIKDLCKEVGVSPQNYQSLQNGMASPLYEQGPKKNEIKSWVARMLKVLKCTFEDAFPRYVCDLSRAVLVDSQMINILCSEYSLNKRPDLNLKRAMAERLRLLPSRVRVALYLYYYEGGTFEEVGEKLGGVTRARADQLVRKGLRILRHPDHSRGLKEYMYENSNISKQDFISGSRAC